jgi:hypothetical protein
MKIEEYPIMDLSDKMIDNILKANKNLLLIGNHGCGKTARVLQCFDRNSLNYVYFSGPTCDPWIDFIGIPTEDGESGNLKFLKPARINEELEAIFVDEYNRMDKAGKNALMELLQFKSINGMKFPKLRVVWASINPPTKEMFKYDVEEMDTAQLDRFQCIIRIASEPSKSYFINRYSDLGENAVKWWSEQAENARNEISSRRLEEAIKAHMQKIPLEIVLPGSSNIKLLHKYFSIDKYEMMYDSLLTAPSVEKYEELIKTNRIDLIKKTFKEDKLRSYTHMAPSEIINTVFLNDEKYRSFVEFQSSVIKDEKFSKIYKDITTFYKNSAVVKDSKTKIKTADYYFDNNPPTPKTFLNHRGIVDIENYIDDVASPCIRITPQHRQYLIVDFLANHKINVTNQKASISNLDIEISCLHAHFRKILVSFSVCRTKTLVANFDALVMILASFNEKLFGDPEIATLYKRLLEVWDSQLRAKYTLHELYSLVPVKHFYIPYLTPEDTNAK